MSGESRETRHRAFSQLQTLNQQLSTNHELPFPTNPMSSTNPTNPTNSRLSKPRTISHKPRATSYKLRATGSAFVGRCDPATEG